MCTFVTSDLHFEHTSMVTKQYRPFQTLEEMHTVLIDGWNQTVSKNDDVWVLGDFIFTNDANRCEYFLRQLNGHKYLIVGNHDNRRILNAKGWVDVIHYKRLKFNDHRFILSHYPILSWHGMHRGAIMLHGHCHGNLSTQLVESIGYPLIDVGVDSWDYKPISFDFILDLVKSTQYKHTIIDHHIIQK